MSKERDCVRCGFTMTVPNNSCRKYCSECRVIRQREISKKWYTKQDQPTRRKANEKYLQKLLEDPVERLFVRARDRARGTGLEFNIERSDIFVPDCCPILRTPFEYNTYYTASIDRIDSGMGYVKRNVQVISHKANAMKNSASREELLMFAEWIRKTYEQ